MAVAVTVTSPPRIPNPYRMPYPNVASMVLVAWSGVISDPFGFLDPSLFASLRAR